jgi:hypothetical protein
MSVQVPKRIWFACLSRRDSTGSAVCFFFPAAEKKAHIETPAAAQGPGHKRIFVLLVNVLW